MWIYLVCLAVSGNRLAIKRSQVRFPMLLGFSYKTFLMQPGIWKFCRLRIIDSSCHEHLRRSLLGSQCPEISYVLQGTDFPLLITSSVQGLGGPMQVASWKTDIQTIDYLGSAII